MTQNDVIIRKATVNNVLAIAKIHICSWQHTYHQYISEDFLKNLSVTERHQEWIERLNANVDVFVAEIKTKVVGFASICPTRDADDDPQKVAEISAIYLLPEFLRQGIGSKLCNYIFQYCIQRNFSQVTLWVLQDNSEAHKFYRNLGFIETGNVEFDEIGDNSFSVIRYRKNLERGII